MKDSRYKPMTERDQDYTEGGRCVRAATHDLNNHLGAILAYAELIGLDLQDKPHLSQMIDEIVQAVQHSTDILDTLASAVSSDNDPPQEIDLVDLIRIVAGFYDYEIRRNGGSIRLTLPPTPCRITAIRPRLTKALMHAIRDAIASWENPLHLNIALEQEGTDYCLTMVDTSGEDVQNGKSPDPPMCESRAHVEAHNGSLRNSENAVVIRLPRDTGLHVKSGA